MIGCHEIVESTTVEVNNDDGNRIYQHNISYDLSLYDDAGASTGKDRQNY